MFQELTRREMRQQNTTYRLCEPICRLLLCHIFLGEPLTKAKLWDTLKANLAADLCPYGHEMEFLKENASLRGVPDVPMFYSNGCVPLYSSMDFEVF